MDIATISSTALTALKTAKDIGKALLDLKIDTDVRLRVSEMLDRLGETQDRLFQVREVLENLQSENKELRDQLAESTHWNSRMEQYALVKTEGGSVVYESRFEPKHYACPSCIESRSIQLLQDTHSYDGTFVCPKCDKPFPIRPPRHPPRRQARSYTC